MGSKDCIHTVVDRQRALKSEKKEPLVVFRYTILYSVYHIWLKNKQQNPLFLSPFMILFLALAHGRRFYFPVVVERCRLHVIPFGQGCLFPFTFCAKTIASESIPPCCV